MRILALSWWNVPQGKCLGIKGTPASDNRLSRTLIIAWYVCIYDKADVWNSKQCTLIVVSYNNCNVSAWNNGKLLSVKSVAFFLLLFFALILTWPLLTLWPSFKRVSVFEVSTRVKIDINRSFTFLCVIDHSQLLVWRFLRLGIKLRKCGRAFECYVSFASQYI